MKDFTVKKCLIVVHTIVVVFAFLDTSEAMSTLAFWRHFLYNSLINVVIAWVVIIALGPFFNNKG